MEVVGALVLRVCGLLVRIQDAVFGCFVLGFARCGFGCCLYSYLNPEEPPFLRTYIRKS